MTFYIKNIKIEIVKMKIPRGVKGEHSTMTFRALSKQDGSIGAEMYASNLIEKLRAASRRRIRRTTPLQVVDSVINRDNLSDSVLPKYEAYRENISHMNFAAAIRYTANFYRKGLATYIPTGVLA